MNDWRNIIHGREIPTEQYSDQPYIVQTSDGAWLCAVTTGPGLEGQQGQHVVTMRSTDQGRTWSAPVDVEPSDGPEASYAVLLKAPDAHPVGGRIFCFYNHNTDEVEGVIADDPPFEGGICRRVDSLGHFVFKVSDDHGHSWSERRFDIPVRTMAIDRENAYQGELQFFWNVGKPFIHEGAAYVSLHKVGGFGEGFFTRSEGVLLKSENLLTEADPAAITWETLPDGPAGLRTPPGGGSIAEEQSYAVLSDGSFFCVYRTIDGYPAHAYSRDGGHTWTTPHYLRYANGRRVKHPRAANFVWRCENGRYLYWYHNHGGRFIGEHPQGRSYAYEHRNPVWMLGGVEVDTPEGKVLQWSQPEIVLYDDDPLVRMSYPDLVEEDGRYFVTETQKDVARVHELPVDLLDGLWGQVTGAHHEREDALALALPRDGSGEVASRLTAALMPPLPPFISRDSSRFDHGTLDRRAGLTLELWLRLHALAPGQILLDNRTEDGRGFCLMTTKRATLALTLHDGQTSCCWDADPEILKIGQRHHVAVIIDGGPKVIVYVVDGKVLDGGDARQFGWGRYSPNLREVNGAPELAIGPNLQGEIQALRIYTRPRRISEIISAYKTEVR